MSEILNLMINKKILFTILLCSPLSIYSQLKINGIVKDSIGIVEYANVTLTDSVGNIVSGTNSNQNGFFELFVTEGHYELIISFIGYENWNTVFNLDEDKNFGIIILNSESTELEGVEIKARKKIFEKKIDRLVFNVKNLPSVQGGNMLDVINVTPRIRIINDQISMIGKDNLQLMINGRLTQITGRNLVDLLNSISAEDIDRIEVITTPPANFSAEGNSGLINIVYKKGKKNAWSSTVRGSFTQATYARQVVSGGYDYNKGSLSIKGNVNLVTGSKLITDESTVFYSDQDWINVAPRRVFYEPLLSGRLALDYQISKNIGVGIQYFGNDNKLKTESKEETRIVQKNTRHLDSVVKTESSSIAKSPTASLNFFTDFKIDTLGKKVTVSLDYLSFKNNITREFFSSNFNSKNVFLEDSFNAGLNVGSQEIKNYSGSLDISLPYEKISMRFGGRLSTTSSENNNTFFNSSTGNPELDTNQSSEFEFEENIQAIYFSLSKTFNEKWEGMLGLRLENTQTLGVSLELNQENKNNYFRLFPSGYISYVPNDEDNFSLSLSSRIRRPSFELLNAFRIIENQYAFTSGNPALQPSFSDNLEFSYTRNNNWLNTIYFSRIKNVFSQVTMAEEQTNIQQTIPFNYFNASTIGLSESYSFSPFHWWESNNFLEFYYSTSNSFVANLDVNGWEVSGYFQTDNSWNLNEKGDINLNASFWIQFPTSGELYSTKQYNNLDLSLNFSMFKEKMDVTIIGSDLLSSQRPQYKEISNNINVEYNQYYDNRALRIALSYTFGNTNIRIRERKFGNDEEKSRTSN
ncbi:TonB-dependent receptor [Mesonia sp.]|uniref:TonB-dependent receptor n=1 Tax=Mesonia sp. TaxID=1960830 RepID=UPI000C9674A5|nr:TonB-dependent receptor [Mesonia sp.]MAN25759.1 hypothetical protein [Mesonia sp.]|tara:strand:+ start:14382 stop:16802 length:2421 start_codon:yes stop_codon:yes gene_type:complete